MADRTETERRPDRGENGVVGPRNGAPNGAQPLPKAKMPGYFEGETVTRRALFTGGAMAAGGIARAAIVLPAIGFALGPVFEEADFPWQPVGPPTDFSRGHLHTGHLHSRRRARRRGRQDDRLRAQAQPTPSTAPDTRTSSSRSPRAARTSAARCAGSAPRSGSCARATAACTTRSARWRADRLSGRSTASTRGSKKGMSSWDRASASTRELKRFSPRDPGEPLDGLWQYLYPKRFTVPSP